MGSRRGRKYEAQAPKLFIRRRLSSGDQQSPWLRLMVTELSWTSAASQGTLFLALLSACISPAHLLTPSLGTTVLGEGEAAGPPLVLGEAGAVGARLTEPGGRSRNRNPERIRPTSSGLVPEDSLSFLLAATTLESWE